MQGNEWRLLFCRGVVVRWRLLVEVDDLEVKQTGALVAADVLLIAIIAKALSTPFGHLSWRQTLERAGWYRRRGLDRQRRRGCWSRGSTALRLGTNRRP
jgi:hypothetical protein